MMTENTELQPNPCRICGSMPIVSETNNADVLAELFDGYAPEVYESFNTTTYCVECNHGNVEGLEPILILCRPAREQAIVDWNKENPLQKRCTKHTFSTEERVRLEKNYRRIRSRIESIQDYPEGVSLASGEDMHIWNRLKQLAEMSYDELMDEIEADYVLLQSKFG